MSNDQLSDLSDLGNQERVYLSDVIDASAFQKGQANIIIAPCHSGKTTAAFKTLAPLASCPEKVLILIDTTAGKASLLNRKETNRYSTRWQREIRQITEAGCWGDLLSGNGTRVMTYHQLGYQLEKIPDLLEAVDVVICDEMHNLIKYKNIEYAKNKANEMLGTENEIKACKLALEELARLSNKKENAPLIIIMTATVNSVSVELDKLNVNTEYFDYTDKVTRDKTRKTIYYKDIEAILSELSNDERAIIYAQSVSQMKKIAEAADNGHRNICCLWSIHNADHQMSEEQLQVRSDLLSQERIPDGIDILCINAAYETSINITNEDFQTMIVHSGNPDTRVQVRGRLRHDIETLYLYDPDHEHISQYFPKEFYGKPLCSADTARIVQMMNLKDSKGKQKKWPSIRRLLELDGTIVENTKLNGVRVCILRESA